VPTSAVGTSTGHATCVGIGSATTQSVGAIAAGATVSGRGRIFGALTDGIRFGWRAKPTDPLSGDALGWMPVKASSRALLDTVGLDPDNITVWGFSAVIADLLNLHSSQTYPFKLHGNLTDLIAGHERVLTAIFASLDEELGLHEISHQARALFILDALSITPSHHTQMVYHLSLLQLIQLDDDLNRFLGGAITEHLGMDDDEIFQFRGNAVIGAGLGLHDILGHSLVFRVILDEEVALHESDILQQILRGTLIDGIQLSAAYVSPGGTFTTWAVNTRTGSTTEYTNWQFNSFAQINGKYVGANATGLYELNGPDDAGTSIIADIKGGLMQLGGSKFTSFKAAYLGVRGGSAALLDGDAGQFYLKLETGDGTVYTYLVNARDMKTTKVNLGKGLRARYFSYQLISTGQDFDLDSIEFLPIVEKRRV
jgi:hypothetical protein